MRKKYGGYILNWISTDHDGTHIHVYGKGGELGVWDLARRQAIRGLKVDKKLRQALKEFENEINQRRQKQQ